MDPDFIVRIALLITSVGVGVGGVGGLGFFLGRYLGRRSGPPPALPPDYERRLRLLEEEFDLTRSEVAGLLEEREFLRRLEPGTKRDRQPPRQNAA